MTGAAHWFAEELARSGLASDRANEAEMTAIEVITNIARHAYSSGTPGNINVAIGRVQGGCVVTIEDTGSPFDPLTAPLAPLTGDRPHGMGLHLLRELADERSYERLGERNRLTLVFRNRNDAG